MSTTGRSNWQAAFKTVLLLSVLGGILVGAGYLIGGPSTALVFLFIAVIINMGSWFFSDRIALAAAGRSRCPRRRIRGSTRWSGT